MNSLLENARDPRIALPPSYYRTASGLLQGVRVKLPKINIKPLGSALIAISLLSACGGGGSNSVSSNPASGTASASTDSAGGTTTPASTGSTGGTTTPAPTGNASSSNLPADVPATTATTMSCAEGANYQCSGSSIIRTENGVTLTSSGVQAYGKSTSDLAKSILDTTTATGFTLASGGIADLRVAKDSNGRVSTSSLLLNNFGISWDGKNERPQIIESFQPTQGRSQLDANGAVNFSLPLPPITDLGYYDFATKGAAATPANYGNNRYFPRPGNPSRCPTGITPCPTAETAGITFKAGDWRTGGGNPDETNAVRLHSDGDIHAGNGLPDANGNPTILSFGTGPGIGYPGSKGFRTLDNWSLQYSNLSTWMTQDTVEIVEWSNGSNEHNQNRRGVVAFGAVSNPASIPTTGTASYSGTVYGWYARNATDDPVSFRGTASVTVNFVTRQVEVTIQNPTAFDGSNATLPAGFKTTAAMGAAGSKVANYLTGTADNGTLKGGVSARYFGPVISSGASGAGPAEVSGAFSLSNAGAGVSVVGGFIARKQ